MEDYYFNYNSKEFNNLFLFNNFVFMDRYSTFRLSVEIVLIKNHLFS